MERTVMSLATIMYKRFYRPSATVYLQQRVNCPLPSNDIV